MALVAWKLYFRNSGTFKEHSFSFHVQTFQTGRRGGEGGGGGGGGVQGFSMLIKT